ncbi:MAG TPA: hypothetical protein VJ397_00765 [Thermoplasmata archaeon]|nr:hypothetical protein [Thermoplasmata archaeon]
MGSGTVHARPFAKNAFSLFAFAVMFAAALSAGSLPLAGSPVPGPMAPPSGPGATSHTNATGEPYHAIPTDDPDDAMFLAVAGSGLSTLGGNDIHIFIGVAAGKTAFELDLFDADTSGHWDITWPGSNDRLIFRLYRDRLKTGTDTSSLVSTWNSDSGVDDGWLDKAFATDSGARAPSGNYFYRLDVAWEDPSAADQVFNNFKVRATAQLGLVPGQDFGFAAGPQNLGPGGDPPVGSGDPDPDPDVNNAGANSYDGEWNWYFYQPVKKTALTFRDGDADYATDTNDFNTPDTDPDGSGEAWAEGVHPGAPADDGGSCSGCNVTPSIRYRITDPDGHLYSNFDPSGNREWEDYIIGPTNADFTVSYNLSAGLWRFRVVGMDAHNFNNLKASAEIFTDSDVPLTVNPAPDVYPDRTGSANPGDLVRYAHTVKNRGSGNDAFDLKAVSSTGWTVRIYHDTDGDGVLDPGENQTENTGTLGPNATYNVIVEIEVPTGLATDTTDVTTITASSTVEWALQDSAKDTTTVDVNRPPTINSFTASTAVEGSATTFTASATDPDGDALTYSFDFDNDGTWDSSGPSSTATRTWWDDHSGVARLRVSDGAFSVETTVAALTLNADPVLQPTVGLSAEGGALTVTYHITDPGSDDETVVVDWGDGTTETRTYLVGGSPDPPESNGVDLHRDFTDSMSHVYGDNAVLPGTITVTDDDGGSAAASLSYVISNVIPGGIAVSISCTPILSTAHACEEGEYVFFSASATDPGSDDLEFFWDFGDGLSESRRYYNDGVGPDPYPSTGPVYPFTATDMGTHAWGDDGEYTITLTVADDDGGLATVANKVQIGNVAPSLVLTPDMAAYFETDAITVARDFSDPGSDDVTLSYSWELGPSGTVTYFNDGVGPDPPLSPWGTFPFTGSDSIGHAYNDNGVYTLTVTATDDDGGSSTATLNLVVDNTAPTITLVDVPGVTYELSAVDATAEATDPGSDDLTFTFEFDYLIAPSFTFYNDGIGPDPAKSPWGTSPFTASATTSATWGDDGVFGYTVTVEDDDGGVATASGTVEVLNVAPAIALLIVPSGDEGQTIQFRADVHDPGSDDLSVTWWGICHAWSPATLYPNDPIANPDPDPSPSINPRDVTDTQDITCGDNGVFAWNLQVEDDDGGMTTVSGTFDIANLPPALAVSPPSAVTVNEANAVTLAATATDPGSDDLTFTWQWDYGPTETRTYFNDGTGPDPPQSPDGTFPFTASDSSTHTYGDDCACAVTLTVTDDDGGSLTYTTTVDVANVAPTIDDVQVYAEADITLRVAGEKWHDVCLDVVDFGSVTASACVTRYPGSPDDQSATISGGRINILGDTAITLYYTPDNDPINGQRNGDNPAWVILIWADGSETRLKHNFNVQHPGTWTWTIDDLLLLLAGKPLTFDVTASDVGSDDLTFDLDFGDGGVYSETRYNNGATPDLYPSPDVTPITATASAMHAYGAAGTYTFSLFVSDDDGGSAGSTRTFTIG